MTEAVQNLISELGELVVRGQKKESIELAQAAAERFEQAQDPLSEAICHVFLGLQAHPGLETDAAIAHYERALPLLVGIDHAFAAAAVSRILGALFQGSHRLDQAEQALKRGLRFLEEFERSDQTIPAEEYWMFASMLGLPPDFSDLTDPFSERTRARLIAMAEGALRTTLGLVFSWSSRLDEAELELERALTLVRKTDGKEAWMVLTHLALVRQERGRNENARLSFEEALKELERQPGSQSATGIRHHRIGLYELLERLDDAQNRRDDALMRNSQALEMARSSGDRLAEVMLLKTQARLLRIIGRDFQAADQLLREAWNKGLELQDPYLEAKLLQERANCAIASGSFELSASYLEQAIARLQELDEPYVEIMAWSLLAISYQSLGAHDRAHRAIREATDLARRMHFPEGRAAAHLVETITRSQQEDIRLEPLLEAFKVVENLLLEPQTAIRQQSSLQALIRAGQLIQQEADPREIVKVILPALKESQDTGAIHHEMMLRPLLGLVYRKQGQLQSAWREWQATLGLVRQRGLRHLEASVLSGLADLAWIEGRREVAVKFSLEGVEVLETTVADVRVDDLLIPFISTNIRLYERAIIALTETGQSSQAFEYSERARARSLLRLLGNQRLRTTGSADPELANEMVSLRSRMAELELRLIDPANYESKEARRDLEVAWRQHDDMLVRIKLAAPRLAELVSPDPVGLHTVQDEILDAKTTLISFYLLHDRVVAWVIDRDRDVFVPTKMSRDDLYDIHCMTAGIVQEARARGTRLLNDCGAGRDLLAEISEKLLAPLMPHVRHRKLILVPHDALHYLPFAALRNPLTGRYLIEEYTLSYAPSVSVLQLLRQGTGSIRRGALVLGDPRGTDPRLPRLSGARREARTVARLFGVEALLGTEATESRVRAPGRAVDLLHLAAHGAYRPENPRFSYLALAAEGNHDGRLEMHEIFEELDLQGVELVVLSACETALGKRTRGDDVVGLTRAFLYAGSQAVMATLWSIHDEGSAELVGGFYRRLRRGMPASEALRRAQLAMINSEKYRSPYYWAGFTLVGDVVVDGKSP